MRTKIYAHRGYSAIYPENTLLAFERALACGVDGIELDVHLSQDGHVVVIHDETLERTTTGQGAIKDLSLADIQACDAGVKRDARFAGEHVPTLNQVLTLLAERQFTGVLNIELKTDIEPYPGLVSAVLACVRHHQPTYHIVYSSFNHQTLVEVLAEEPTAAVAILFTQIRQAKRRLPNGQPVTAWHAPVQGLPFIWLLRSLRVVTWPVRLWTVNTEAQMRKSFRQGIDAIMTDDPELAIAERERWYNHE